MTVSSVNNVTVSGNGRTATTRKRSRQERRSGRTHAKLIDAARSVFSERGLDLTTVDDITERADLGRGTFYYHFGNKEELIRQMIREMLAELTARIQNECAKQETLGPILDALIGVHISYFRNRWEDFVLYFQGRADLTLERSYEGIETPFLDYIRCIEGVIDDALTQPIPKPKLRRLACAIAGFISGYYSFASVATEDEDIDRSFAALRSAFVASLARFVTEAVPTETD
jgi:AcrR family transcriptional regulator